MPVVRLAGSEIDLESGVVVGPRPARLTPRELELLRYLVHHPGEVIGRDRVLVDVFGYHPNTTSRAVDKAMHGLRAKVERDPSAPEHLIKVHNAGYRFVAAAEPPSGGTEPNGFVGREAELLHLAGCLARPGLTTLKGPPGVGKTRLAAVAVRAWTQATGGTSWRVDLAGAEGAVEWVRRVGTRLGAADGVEAVARSLAGHGPAVLVLDHADGLAGDLGAVEGWRRAAPDLRLLLTSRRRLDLPGAEVVPLEPLPPDDGLALLARRATERGFPVERDDVTRELVRRLDGLPLALELAASRLAVWSPAQILARLGPLDLLGTGLRAALDWSWTLLDGPEKTLLAELSVFEGGFEVEQAEQVVGGPSDGRAVVDVLAALLDASLVVRRHEAGAVRLDLLGAVRSYAREKLDALGPATTDRIERLHGWVYARLGAGAAAARRGPGEPEALRTLRRETGNLLAACRGAVARVEAEVAVETAEAVGFVLRCDAGHRVGVELVRGVLRLPNLRARDRARMLLVEGSCLLGLGDPAESLVALEPAAVLATEAADQPTRAEALRLVAMMCGQLGRMAEARAALAGASEAAIGQPVLRALTEQVRAKQVRAIGDTDECLRIYLESAQVLRRIGWDRGEGWALSQAAHCYQTWGEHDQAEALYVRALARFERAGATDLASSVRGQLGLIALNRGDVALGMRLVAERISHDRRTGDHPKLVTILGTAAFQLRDAGQREAAAACAREGEALGLSLGLPGQVAVSRMTLGRIALDEGRTDDAIRILAGCERELARLEEPRVRIFAVLDLMEALHLAGRTDELPVFQAEIEDWLAHRRSADRDFDERRARLSRILRTAPDICGAGGG